MISSIDSLGVLAGSAGSSGRKPGTRRGCPGSGVLDQRRDSGLGRGTIRSTRPDDAVRAAEPRPAHSYRLGSRHIAGPPPAGRGSRRWRHGPSPHRGPSSPPSVVPVEVIEIDPVAASSSNVSGVETSIAFLNPRPKLWVAWGTSPTTRMDPSWRLRCPRRRRSRTPICPSAILDCAAGSRPGNGKVADQHVLRSAEASPRARILNPSPPNQFCRTRRWTGGIAAARQPVAD